MSKKPWAVSALLIALALPGCARGAEIFAGGDVFQALLADPREMQISAAYYRLGGQNTGDVGLGHSWGMARWNLADRWQVQSDIAGLAYSRFRVSGSVNELQTIDFVGELPLTLRRDGFSGRAMLFHQSSHLGDDYIRRTGDLGFRYSVDGLRALLSQEFHSLRVYGGGGYLLHTVPAPQRGMLQGGVELVSPGLPWFKGKHPSYLYLAEDVQSRQDVGWNVNSRSVLGVRVKAEGSDRAVRFQVGRFQGHSPFGQFFRRKEQFSDVTIVVEF